MWRKIVEYLSKRIYFHFILEVTLSFKILNESKYRWPKPRRSKNVIKPLKMNPHESCSSSLLSLALNGGGHIFSLPVLALIFPACSLCLVSSIERLSLHGSPNWKIMDLINWSLNAIDTIFSSRSLGSGEPDCPNGTFAAGYTMDAWERWRIIWLAALSVEDIEDIDLFGTMITGILLIGLGFALGYRRIQKTGTAVQSLTRLPVMTEAVGRVVSIETETINRNMDSIMEKLTACRGKFILETRMDKESSRGIGMRLLALRQNNRNLIFWLPRTVASAKATVGNSTLGRALQWDALASSPILQTLIINYYTHTHTYLPSPDPSPPSLWTASLTGKYYKSCEEIWSFIWWTIWFEPFTHIYTMINTYIKHITYKHRSSNMDAPFMWNRFTTP